LDLVALERLKKRVAAQYRETTIGDLETMIVESRRAVEASPLFASAVVRKTGTRYRQIEVECRLANRLTPHRRIAAEITRIWLEELRFDDFEAHAVAATDTAIMLDYLTVARAPRLYATGMIVVSLS
jgi:hypothetical protein